MHRHGAPPANGSAASQLSGYMQVSTEQGVDVTRDSYPYMVGYPNPTSVLVQPSYGYDPAQASHGTVPVVHSNQSQSFHPSLQPSIVPAHQQLNYLRSAWPSRDDHIPANWGTASPTPGTIQSTVGTNSDNGFGVGEFAVPPHALSSTYTHSRTPAPSSTATTSPVPMSVPYPQGERDAFRMGSSGSAETEIIYPCKWSTRHCGTLVAGNRIDVALHLREHHRFVCDGDAAECLWDGCRTRMQRRNIPRHIVSSHLEVRVRCPTCGMLFSRVDASKTHQRSCPALRSRATLVWPH